MKQYASALGVQGKSIVFLYTHRTQLKENDDDRKLILVSFWSI
jgi:hypothetical protein